MLMGGLSLLGSCGGEVEASDAHYRVDGELGSYLTATYPQMTEGRFWNLSRKKLNAAVEERVLGEIEGWRGDVIEGAYEIMERMTTDPSTYGASCRDWRCEITSHIGHLEHDSVSLALKMYWYTGGAHGNWFFEPLNLVYSDNGVEEVSLEALFDPAKEWRSVLDPLLWAGFIELSVAKGANQEDVMQLRSDTDSQVGLHKGTSFTYSAEGITFYYEPYKLSSFAGGDFLILVPMEEIEELLNLHGPMGRYL